MLGILHFLLAPLTVSLGKSVNKCVNRYSKVLSQPSCSCMCLVINEYSIQLLLCKIQFVCKVELGLIAQSKTWNTEFQKPRNLWNKKWRRNFRNKTDMVDVVFTFVCPLCINPGMNCPHRSWREEVGWTLFWVCGIISWKNSNPLKEKERICFNHKSPWTLQRLCIPGGP